MTSTGRLHEYRTFVVRAVKQPSTVGAVLPTSQHVAAAMAGIVPSSGTPTVVELGPGTGALSDAIRERLPENGRHVAVEIDPEMVRYLRSAKPWLEVVEGDASSLRGLLRPLGIERVDAVVSSIPWTLLAEENRRKVLDEIGKTLEPGGAFTAITYLTALWRRSSRDFAGALHATFDEVLPRSTVWRNVPPARVYVCRRPR